jgi:uncharacterized membrane protein
MITYQSQVTIDRPVAEVFEYVTNFDNLPSWSDTHSVKRLSNGGNGPGAKFILDMGKGPMRSQLEFATTQWEQDRNWSFKTSSAGPFVWDGTYRFEPAGDSATRVSQAGQVTLKGWRRLLEPLVRLELQKGEQSELIRLKDLLESD